MRGEFVDLAGTRLYYYAAGSRGAGDPVVFLHGFPGSSHSWRQMIPLMPEGRRLVVVDLMGFGRSDFGRGDASPPRLAHHVGLVRQLLDDLSIATSAIIGHGIGGTIAQAIAIGHPDRVSALGLCSCPAFDVWPRRLARLARLAAPGARLLGPAMLASFVHGSAIRGFADRDAGRRALDVALRPYPAHLGVEALTSQLALMRDAEIAGVGARLGTIGVPTAVIWGARDPFLPVALGKRIAAAIPGATIDIIPDARHFINEDAPEQCARLASTLLSR